LPEPKPSVAPTHLPPEGTVPVTKPETTGASKLSEKTTPAVAGNTENKHHANPFRLANHPHLAQVDHMPRLHLQSSVEQTAAHLRADLASGRLRGLMPGVLRLEAELGVNRKTIDAALRQLQREGLLAAQGAGRRRRIVESGESAGARPLRVALLLSEPSERRLDYLVELRHELADAGHSIVHVPGSLVELGMDVGRVAGLVERTAADAWVVAGGSLEVLEWFSRGRVPVFALFGRWRSLKIAAAGPDKSPIYAEVAREFIRLGHRRVVLLARSRRLLPKPGTTEQAFLDALAAHGLPVGDYNLPLWEETPEGFHARLGSLFRFTPPTAMLIDEAPFMTAAMQFLAGRGLRVPRDVSLVCMDSDPSFEWCRPMISHIRWDSGPVVRRIVRWAENLSRGKADLLQSLTPAEFVRGGTIGPARG
jgi:hypothetical protein